MTEEHKNNDTVKKQLPKITDNIILALYRSSKANHCHIRRFSLLTILDNYPQRDKKKLLGLAESPVEMSDTREILKGYTCLDKMTFNCGKSCSYSGNGVLCDNLRISVANALIHAPTNSELVTFECHGTLSPNTVPSEDYKLQIKFYKPA